MIFTLFFFFFKYFKITVKSGCHSSLISQNPFIFCFKREKRASLGLVREVGVVTTQNKNSVSPEMYWWGNSEVLIQF